MKAIVQDRFGPPGTLVVDGGGSPGEVVGAIGGIARAVVLNPFVRQRIRPLPDRWDRRHLLALTEFVAARELVPVVDRTYALADVADEADGLRHVESGHARGKCAVTVSWTVAAAGGGG